MASTPNGADAAPGDGLGNPPPGIVLPPAAVREVIVKTADFVGRRGPDMLLTLRRRSGHEAKFSFLNEGDPYYPYFDWCRAELAAGRGPSGAAAARAQPAQPAKPKGPPAPAPYKFSARMPNINAKDLEVVKLTALYTARNGQNWLTELQRRENQNVQFEFLRPQHSFHNFFRALIAQYKILINDQDNSHKARIEELRKNVENRFHVLDRAKERAEYAKFKEQEREKAEKKQEEERKEYASIDWHDFAVIQTVEFDEADELADLPPPTPLNDLQSASLEQKAQFSLSRRIEEAAPDDVVNFNATQPTQPSYVPPPMPMPQPMAPPVQPAYSPAPLPARDYRTPPQARYNEEERAREMPAQAPANAAPGPMRIRTDYVPRAARKQNVATAICPNCKQTFPADELEAHIRIELLDPRWKEQRERSDARYNKGGPGNAEIAANLKRLASMREDPSEEELARRKRAALQYDGQPDPAKDAYRLQEMQSMNLQDQLRRIEEKHGRK